MKKTMQIHESIFSYGTWNACLYMKPQAHDTNSIYVIIYAYKITYVEFVLSACVWNKKEKVQALMNAIVLNIINHTLLFTFIPVYIYMKYSKTYKETIVLIQYFILLMYSRTFLRDNVPLKALFWNVLPCQKCSS